MTFPTWRPESLKSLQADASCTAYHYKLGFHKPRVEKLSRFAPVLRLPRFAEWNILNGAIIVTVYN